MPERVADRSWTRRELVRRGLLVGGAVVWTTPLVQTLSISDAAAVGSPPPSAPGAPPAAPPGVGVEGGSTGTAPSQPGPTETGTAVEGTKSGPNNGGTGSAAGSSTKGGQPASALPKTGAAVPVGEAAAVGAALVAAGGALHYVARRRSAEAAIADPTFHDGE